jgi:hypothetical protein
VASGRSRSTGAGCLRRADWDAASVEEQQRGRGRRPPGAREPLDRCRGRPTLAAAILGLDFLEGSNKTQFVGLLVSVPFLAAALVGPRRTLACGVITCLAGYLFGFTQVDAIVSDTLRPTSTQATRLSFLAAAAVAGVMVSHYRIEREARLRRVAKVAEIAQATVLRPMPAIVGPLRLAVRYASATAEAGIGGDLYEALDTPYGARVLLGDVRGKGLDAVHLASIVLGAFREAAYVEPDPADLLVAIDRSVRRVSSDEDFVTALVVQVDAAGKGTVVNCAHPPPLLVRAGHVSTVEPAMDALPLGLLDGRVSTRRLDLVPGDRLLLYTDGASEARRDGRFFDLEAAVTRLLPGAPLDEAVEGLVAELRAHVRGRLKDDVALLAVGFPGHSGDVVEGTEMGSLRAAPTR